MKFSIITPVYNAENYIKKCTDSVLSQSYTNWELFILNDNSSDKTSEILRTITDPRIKVFNRTNNVGALTNHIMGLKLSSGDVMIHLDGDDWLSNNNVLSYLFEIYSNNKILATYGNYETTTNEPSICRELLRNVKVRDTILGFGGWKCSHLRTFRKELISKINALDLFYPDGSLLDSAADVAITCSIFDYAKSQDGLLFIQDVLVIYNRSTLLNDDKVNPSKQIRSAISIARNTYI